MVGKRPPLGKILKTWDYRHGTGEWSCTTGYCLPLNIPFTPPPRKAGLSKLDKGTTSPSNTGERLYNLIEGAYLAINSPQPELKQACWLCMAPSAPYYEGIAITGNITYASSVPESPISEHTQVNPPSNRKRNMLRNCAPEPISLFVTIH